MIVEHFLKWSQTAKVSQRASAANALARAYLRSSLSFEERCAAEAALTLLLEDPSPKVRLAMAEALSLSPAAPPQIVAALAADQAEIAAMVLVRSPLLSDGDLIDHVAACEPERQRSIAMRPRLSVAVSAALAELAAPEACVTLLRNGGAAIAPISIRRMAERHGADGRVREALLGDARLPWETRHALLLRVGAALSASPLVRGMIGAARAERVTRDACIRASLALIDSMSAADHAALVEHLRIRGDLTQSFLIRAVAHGKIDFFGAALVALTGEQTSRVHSLLNGGRDLALAALFRSAGLAAHTHSALIRALQMWREVARGTRLAGAQEVAFAMLQSAEIRASPSDSERELAALLRSIHLELLRENARSHALAIAAAA